MQERDYKDLASSAVLILLGGSAAIYSTTHYSLGSLRQLGPGAFPAFLGVLLILFGLGIGISALRNTGAFPKFELVPFLSVVGGVIAFGITIEPFGLIPAIVVLIVIATLAERRLNLTSKVLLPVVLSVGCSGIFIFGLGLTFQVVKWPF